MNNIFAIIIIIAVLKFIDWYNEYKLDTYMPPEGKTLDWSRITQDGLNGKSRDHVRSDIINGRYDVPVDKEKMRF